MLAAPLGDGGRAARRAVVVLAAGPVWVICWPGRGGGTGQRWVRVPLEGVGPAGDSRWRREIPAGPGRVKSDISVSPAPGAACGRRAGAGSAEGTGSDGPARRGVL